MPSPFSQEQDEDLKRRGKQILVRVAIGYILLLCGLGFALFEIKEVVHKVDVSSKSQLINRAENVATWCESINEGREKFRKVLSINYLPCKALVVETYESSKGGEHATLQSVEDGLKH